MWIPIVIVTIFEKGKSKSEHQLYLYLIFWNNDTTNNHVALNCSPIPDLHLEKSSYDQQTEVASRADDETKKRDTTVLAHNIN